MNLENPPNDLLLKFTNDLKTVMVSRTGIEPVTY